MHCFLLEQIVRWCTEVLSLCIASLPASMAFYLGAIVVFGGCIDNTGNFELVALHTHVRPVL